MMKVLVLCFVAALWLQLPSGGDAVCCRKHSFEVRAPDGVWHKGDVCGDCSPGTPYCSFQGCNMFGCNCDGGCRSGLCDGKKFAHQMRSLRALPSNDAHDVIRAADHDGDGKMSIEEAHAFLAREAVPANHVKRSEKGHAHLAREAVPANHDKRSEKGHAHLAREAVAANHVKRSEKGHAHLAREAVPANRVKRSEKGHAHLAREAVPANRVKRSSEGHAHIRRSLEAMDIDKDNYLSAREIDCDTK